MNDLKKGKYMSNKEYHMYFTLGDDSDDGHCIKEEIHIVANYSVAKIDKVIAQFKQETKFDISNWASEYEDSSLPVDDVEDLVKLGFIADKTNIKGIDSNIDEDDHSNDEYYIDGSEGYVEFIFEVIVKHYLPDFTWRYYSIPNEQCLTCMDGNGYGLYHP